MPRLNEILDRNQLPEDKRTAFDYLAETRCSVRVPFSLVLNSPEVASRVAHLGTYIRFESSLPKLVTELATLTVAREHDCRHEWAMHTGFAREAGVSEAALEAVGRGQGLDVEEALTVRFARELLRQKAVSAETFAAVQERFGDQGAIDLTATVGYYSLMACLLNALEVIPPPEAVQLPQLGASAR